MATYREIHGKAIKSVSSDPSDDYVAGQVWYNTTSNTFKTVVSSAAWSSATPLITATATAAGFGTQTASLTVGGRPAGGGSSNASQQYNGSGFSSTPNINTARKYLGGCGSTTAGLVFGGFYSPPAGGKNESEEYNGSSWSEGDNLGTARYGLAGAGTQTAGLAFGGQSPISTATEEYGGTSWTSGNAMNTARMYLAGFGLQTAAIAAGGQSPASTNLANTESYDGTNWTTVNSLNTSRGSGLGSSGTSTSGIVFGGLTTAPAPGTGTGATETWDGTSWTTSPGSLATGRYFIAGAGADNTAAVALGGRNAPDSLSNTEEFNQSINVFTGAAWASASGLVGSAREHIGGAGSSTSGLAFGGESAPTNYNETEEWNGSSWTAGGAYPSKDESIMGCGLTASTALAFGGIGNAPGSPPVTRQAISAKYDGSSWTTTNSLPTAKRAGQGFGINTSAVCMGGDTSPTATQNTVEEWDGTNWTAVPNAPFAKGNMGGGTGTLTAGLVFGGQATTATGTTYEYDGTNWTAGGTMASARTNVNGFGGPAGQTASICAGGYTTTQTAVTEGYDGTAWSSRPSLGTARMGSANGIGTSQTAGVQAGGHDTSTYVTTVEEWTGETSSVNVKTLTQS